VLGLVATRWMQDSSTSAQVTIASTSAQIVCNEPKLQCKAFYFGLAQRLVYLRHTNLQSRCSVSALVSALVAIFGWDPVVLIRST
jgi:hypothetical protein